MYERLLIVISYEQILEQMDGASLLHHLDHNGSYIYD